MTFATSGATQDARAATCSRAGCRSVARHSIAWRNPRIHAEARTKTWLACDDHRAVLADFLLARDFPVSVTALPTQTARAELLPCGSS